MKTNPSKLGITLSGVLALIVLTARVHAAALAYTVFVTRDNNTIEKFTPEGVGSVFASSGLSSPQGLAFDSAGNLYVVNNGNNTIEKFTPEGVGSVFASAAFSNPAGLAFDSVGNLYVADLYHNAIVKFTPGGVSSIFAINAAIR